MIYLLGGSGYVGSTYQAFFRKKGIAYRNLRRADLDYTNAAVLRAELLREKPEFLVNAAGYTGKPNVDACELHKAECLFGNAVLPGIVAEACESAGIPWGHVSSGCIYSGNGPGGKGFSEADAPNFTFRSGHCSFYSGTKGLGEEVLDGRTQTFVWRLRIPFDGVDNPRNFLTKMMRYPRLLEATNSVSELDEFVEATFECWKRRVPFGVYNVTNPGSITTREVTELIRKSGVSKKEFVFFSSEEEFMAQAAKTPRSNCILDCSKLERAGVRLTPVREAIERDLKAWRAAA